LHFGPLPLRRWRTWLRGRLLTLHNNAATPLRWELEGETRSDAEVRIWSGGRAQRRAEGTLLPGQSTELELVAAGQSGARQGRITLRCGAYVVDIPWSGEAQPGLPLGNRLVRGWEDLDLNQPGLVPLLEELLRRGTLERWLSEQGLAQLAAEARALRQSKSNDALARRLLVSAMLHTRDAHRFPRLQVRPLAWQGPALAAGGSGQAAVLVVNTGSAPCTLTWISRCSWAGLSGTPVTLNPGQRYTQPVLLLPPLDLAPGSQPVALELRAAMLALPVVIEAPLVAPRWWQRLLSRFVRP
jgi:hypothetical protein